MEALCQLVRDDGPAVRREAAKALGRIGSESAIPTLLDGLATCADRAEEHALIYALLEINAVEPILAGLASTKPTVRRGALIAVDQIDSNQLTADVVASFLESSDEPLRQAAVELFRSRPQWSTKAASLLEGYLQSTEKLEQRPDLVRGLASRFVQDPAVGRLIGRTLASRFTSSTTRTLLLEAIQSAEAPPLHKSWVKPLESLLATNKRELLERAISAVSKIKSDHFDAQLKTISIDSENHRLVRIAALDAVSGNGSKVGPGAFRLLTELLRSDSSVASARAAQMVGRASLTNDQLIELASFLNTAGPLELRELIKPFQRSQHAHAAQAFLTAMDGARGLLSLAPHEFSDVIKRYPPELLATANPLLDRILEHEQQKQRRLEQLLPLLQDGDPRRGHAVFAAEKSKCRVCHRVGKEGGAIGPDLSRIGRIRNSRDLLEAVVFPSASLVREYEPYNVVTADGKVLSGLIVRETETTVYLQQQIGEPLAIPREDIDEISPSTTSIMPNGLEQALSESELADVIAYLLSLK